MRPNSSGEGVLPRVLAGLGYYAPHPVSAAARRRDLAKRVALKVLPRPVARAIGRRVVDPHAVEELAERVWLESADWSRTRAWAESEHGSATIRINQRGASPRARWTQARKYESVREELVARSDVARGRRHRAPGDRGDRSREDVAPGPLAAELPDLVAQVELGRPRCGGCVTRALTA